MPILNCRFRVNLYLPKKGKMKYSTKTHINKIVLIHLLFQLFRYRTPPTNMYKKVGNEKHTFSYGRKGGMCLPVYTHTIKKKLLNSLEKYFQTNSFTQEKIIM